MASVIGLGWGNGPVLANKIYGKSLRETSGGESLHYSSFPTWNTDMMLDGVAAILQP